MKDLGGHILGFGAIPQPADGKGVQAVKILLVQLGKPAWILLGCFNQQPLIGEVANCAQIRAPWTTGSVYLANPAEGGKGYGSLGFFLLPSGISCRNRIYADMIPGMIR